MECSPKINSNLVRYWPTMTCAVLYSSASRLGNTLIGHQSKFGPCLGSRDGGLLHPTACCSSSVSMFRFVMTMRTATSVTESSSSLKDCRESMNPLTKWCRQGRWAPTSRPEMHVWDQLHVVSTNPVQFRH